MTKYHSFIILLCPVSYLLIDNALKTFTFLAEQIFDNVLRDKESLLNMMYSGQCTNSENRCGLKLNLNNLWTLLAQYSVKTW